MQQWQDRVLGTGARVPGPNQWVKDEIDAMIDAAPLPPIPPPGAMGRGCRALRSVLRRGRACRAAAAARHAAPATATAPGATSARTP